MGSFALIFASPQKSTKLFFAGAALICCGAIVGGVVLKALRYGKFFLWQPGFYKWEISRDSDPVDFWIAFVFYLAVSAFLLLAGIEVIAEWVVWPIPLSQYWWQFHMKYWLYFEMIGWHW
ncbi:hypothetical protein [Paraburkholderia sacchari]|uniref:hypothetical protein n=1 Tax=Paraburkholderia sacchari TaxID=159450 RepID=UPI0039A4A1A2